MTAGGRLPDGPLRILTRSRRIALGCVAAAYLLGAAIIYLYIDDDAVSLALSLPIATVAVLLILSLVNYTVRAWRWLVFSAHLGLPVPPTDNALYYLAGFSLTATPGKAGEAVRLWFLNAGHQVPYTRSMPVMVGDRIIDMWAVALIVLCSMSGFAAYHWQSAALGLLILACSVPILFPGVLNPTLNALLGLMPGQKRRLARLRTLVRAMRQLSSLRTYGLTLAPTIIGWIAEGLALYLLVLHFGADIGFMSTLFIFAFSMIVGAVSMLPGGLGSTEATMVLLMTSLGMGLDEALAATAIFRIVTFWFAVILGLICVPLAMSTVARHRLRGAVAHSAGAR